MQEKRKVKRFDLNIETMVRVHGLSTGSATMKFFSLDVSSAGIFLITENPLPLGTMVDVSMLIENELPGMHETITITLNNSGRVIRTSGQGMAIHFKKHTQLAPRLNSPSQNRMFRPGPFFFWSGKLPGTA